MKTKLTVPILVIPALLAGLFWFGHAQAAGITVTSAADTQSNDGQCTLREAIINANRNNTSGSIDCAPGGSADTIIFAGNYTITLSSSLPALTSPLTIDGTGRTIRVSGNKAVRVFHLQAGGVVTLNHLSLINGAVVDDVGAGILAEAGTTLTLLNTTLSTNTTRPDIFGPSRGGGIYNAGTLAIINSTLSGNSASGDQFSADGGGIFNAGLLAVSNSTLSNNETYGRGGGIINTGTLVVSNSLILGNFSTDGGGIYSEVGAILTVTNSIFSGNVAFTPGGDLFHDGGGIFNRGASLILHTTFLNNAAANGGGLANTGSLTVTGSTLSGNSTRLLGFSGGGIVNGGTLIITGSTLVSNSAGFGGGIGNYGVLAMTNSTVSGNSATREGGGIFNSDSFMVRLTNSTLSGNKAQEAGGGLNNKGTLHLSNTLIANSTGGGDCANQTGGLIVTHLNNLIENGSCKTANATNFRSGDPKLGPLQDNGGPTFTHALQLGSPAINTGNNAAAASLPFDQRGPGFPRLSNTLVDIGAFESQFEATFYLPLIRKRE